MVPSSPNLPCSTGNTTSTDSSACTPAAGSTVTRPLVVGSPGSTTARPPETAGTSRPVIFMREESASVSTHAPAGVIPTGTTS